MEQSAQLLSDIIVYSKYAKYRPEFGRRETWEELVTRNMEMHLRRFPQLEKEILQAYKTIFAHQVFPSMRSLQFSGKPIEINPARSYNCSYLAMDDWRAFGEIMFLLLGGTGCGFSVQRHHVEKLPPVLGPIQKKRRHLVGDSIEGWAEAINVLIGAYFFGKSDPVFDLSDVRPKGSTLVTSGGKAPGPQPLVDCFHNLRKILDNVPRGEQLTPLQVHDLVCWISDTVISGGIRRAALISLFSFDDQEMLTCKTGNWQDKNPQRRLANNSPLILRHRIQEEEFTHLWDLIRDSRAGEPSPFFSNTTEMGINPCLTGDTLVYLADGRGGVSIKQLADENVDVPVFCRGNDGKTLVRYMRNPRLTGYKQQIYKVSLDDGSSIRCTGNHKLLLKTGVYREVKDLKSGDSLSILTRFQASIKDIFPKANSHSQDYWWIKDTSSTNRGEHRLIASFAYDAEIPTGFVVHHKDFNARNNSPSNLQILSKKEHDALHAKHMLGDLNPMRRAKTEWSEEKWAAYRAKHSNNTKQENNPRFSGITNDQLREHARILTRLKGYRFSLKDWLAYANEFGLPQKFSKWREDHLGGIVGLAKWAAREEGIENLDLDPRSARKELRLQELGYDYRRSGTQILIKKFCEKCQTEFDTTREEVGFCKSCSGKKIWEDAEVRQKMLDSMFFTHETNRQILREEQAKIYLDLKFSLGRDPWKVEWVKACKDNNTSCEISRESSPFRNFDALKEYASTSNHRVVSVELDGIEDVYNGTVDEVHNFFIGGFQGTAATGKPKEVWLNNQQCGEVSLRNLQVCNLTTVNVSNVTGQEDLNNRVTAAAFLGTLQASYTDFHFLREGWRKVTEKEALLGVSMTGIASNRLNGLSLPEAAKHVLEENTRVTKLIGINRSARSTTQKPDGTVSLVGGTSSGIHGWFSPHYVRRVTLQKDEPIYLYLKDRVPYLIEDNIYKPTIQAMLSLPINAPAGAILGSEPSLDTLERIKYFYHNWILPGHRKGDNTHNVSATVYVKDSEWEEVGRWMWENRNSYNGITTLPYDGHIYKQAPMEAISEETFNELTNYIADKKIDLREVIEADDNTTRQQEIACSSGSCDLQF